MVAGEWSPYQLRFRFEARTSRETMRVKPTYFVRLSDPERPGVSGIGECALFRGLSADDRPDYEELLSYYCAHPQEALTCPYSSIRFGFETAFADLAAGGRRILFGRNDWTDGRQGIRINGLIWMGDKATMCRRIAEKLDTGFSVLKLKIGGIRFDDEVELLRGIRRDFDPSVLELRLDANGSFPPDRAMERLKVLSDFCIHSIEQPVRAGQPEIMAGLCESSPIAIALDEELIGMRDAASCAALLDKIAPQYIILKPALCGGFSGADTWIAEAEKRGTGWWATSALESDIGLNAIAQWLAAKNPTIPQGLGTGQLYENNIPSPLECRGERLFYRPEAGAWGDTDRLSWRK